MGPIAYNPSVLARAAGWLDRAAFSPDTLPDDLVIGVALAPPVAAGLIIFRLAAVEMLVVALVCGIAAQVVARLWWRGLLVRPQTSPIIAGVVGVALVGPGAPIVVSIEIALLAVTLEVLRARYMPAVNAQMGLLAYAGVALVTRGAPSAYLNPANGKAFADPIGIWVHYFGPAAAPIDPVRLYIGNVPGPVFATSLMAVAIGVAWMAYARRLSPIVTISFLLGAIVPVALFHWDFLFQLDSGPTWFVGAMILADRHLLPGSRAIRPILGFGAGAIALGLRNRGVGIEGAFFAVAGIQALVALMVAALLTITGRSQRRERNRLLRQRDEQLRAVNPNIERAS
jgi:hypothetical protein